jgi:hypothetical protein
MERITGGNIMAIIKDEWLIPIGCICLATSILLDRFVPGDGIVDFLIGILTGVSIVLNLVGLHKSRTQ